MSDDAPKVYKWRIQRWDDIPEKREVVKQTAKMITYIEPNSWLAAKPRNELAKNDWFDTFEDAKAEIVRRKTSELGSAKRAEARAASELERVTLLENVEGAENE